MSPGRPQARVRPARPEEAGLIRRWIWRERLDPTALKWSNFVVAVDEAGDVLGIAQMKRLGGKSWRGRQAQSEPVRELGSLVVRPDVRGQGIGRLLVQHLLRTHPAPIHLLCEGRNVSYYRQFGFREIKPEEMPSPLRRKWRLGHLFARLAGRRVAAMVWEGPRGDGNPVQG